MYFKLRKEVFGVAQLIVLAKDSYDFTSRGTNERIVGQNLFAIDPSYQENDGRRVGYIPQKIPCTPDVLRKVTEFPGVYDLGYIQRADSKGRPQLVCTEAVFKGKSSFMSAVAK